MRLLCVLAALLLAACAAPQTRALMESHAGRPSPVELTSVPFFPQTEHQCGPSALATVLGDSGIAVNPEALTPQVYLPGREGSLAIELIAATRRYERVAWRIPPTISAALAEIASGKPVLFLQNRSFAFAPLWHYAVLVGYDLERREVILRSGPLAREIMSLDTFEHTWARSDYWAVVVTKPDELPDFVSENEAMQQGLALEKGQHLNSAHQLYARMVQRWPDDDPARFGLANTAYALGYGASAEAQWRQLLDSPKPLLPVFYNLGQYLLEQGRRSEAKAILQRARTLWPVDRRLDPLENDLQNQRP
ncbi:MAG: PA2778 family cysteine peptidase [Formivibrio sp.]|nr:PA2778 family cysteine peptidase [Formivibrio sp.]